MTGRAGHAGMRRAFLLAPLLVAGWVWPAAGAGSVSTYPVPVVINDAACDPSVLVVGDTCALWRTTADPAGGEFGFANLSMWDVQPGTPCVNAGSSSRGEWIAFWGYPDTRTLNGDPAGSAPTYVCVDTGHSTRDWSDLAAQEGTVKQFPVNDCNGQLDAVGDPAPCPAAPDEYDIVMFARMRILHAYKGNDPAAIGMTGSPPTPRACGLRASDPNAICLVLEFRGDAVRPDVQVGHSHGGPFVGDGLYDAGGAGQVVDEVITRGERAFVVFRIQNDGEPPTHSWSRARGTRRAWLRATAPAARTSPPRSPALAGRYPSRPTPSGCCSCGSTLRRAPSPAWCAGGQ